MFHFPISQNKKGDMICAHFRDRLHEVKRKMDCSSKVNFLNVHFQFRNQITFTLEFMYEYVY